MGIKKKYIILAMLVVTIAWIWNVQFFYKRNLKVPIVLKHYYELSNDNNELTLYYIDNNNSDTNLIEADIPDIGVSLYAKQVNDWGTYGYYKLKSVGLVINEEDMNKIQSINGISKVRVSYSDKGQKDIDLGKISFYKTPKASETFEVFNSATMSDGYQRIKLQATKKLKIVKVDCNINNFFNNAVEVKINSIDLSKLQFPFQVKQWDLLDVYYKFNLDSDDINKNIICNSIINITAQDESGKLYNYPLSIMNQPRISDNIDLSTLNNER